MFKDKSKMQKFALATMLLISSTAYAASTLSVEETMRILDNASYDDDYGYYRIDSIRTAARYLSRVHYDEDGNESYRYNVDPIFTNSSTQGMLNLVASQEAYIDKYASADEWKSLLRSATYYNVSAGNLTRQQLLDRIATDTATNVCNANSIESASMCLAKDAYQFEGGVAAFYSAYSGMEGALAYLQQEYPTFFNKFATSYEKAAAARGAKEASPEYLKKAFGKVWSQSDYDYIVSHPQANQTTVGTDANNLPNPDDSFTQLGQQDDDTSNANGGNNVSGTQQGAKAVSAINEAVSKGTVKEPKSIQEAAQAAVKTGSADSVLDAYAKTGDTDLLAYISQHYPDFFNKYVSQSEATALSQINVENSAKNAAAKIKDYEAGKSVNFTNGSGSTVSIKQDAKGNTQTQSSFTSSNGAQISTTENSNNGWSAVSSAAAGALAGAAAGAAATGISTSEKTTKKREEENEPSNHNDSSTSNSGAQIDLPVVDNSAEIEQYVNNGGYGSSAYTSSSSGTSSAGSMMSNAFSNFGNSGNSSGEEGEEEEEEQKEEKAEENKMSPELKAQIERVQKAMERGVLQNLSKTSK